MTLGLPFEPHFEEIISVGIKKSTQRASDERVDIHSEILALGIIRSAL